MNRKVSKQEYEEQNLQEKYALTKEEAFDILKKYEVSEAKNTQVLNRWLKEGEIDGVLISKGRVEERGWRISEESLLNFIEYRKMTFGAFLAMKQENERLKQQLAQASEKAPEEIPEASEPMALEKEEKANTSDSEPSEELPEVKEKTYALRPSNNDRTDELVFTWGDQNKGGNRFRMTISDKDYNILALELNKKEVKDNKFIQEVQEKIVPQALEKIKR